MDILSDKIVTTRKDHRCDACCRKFPKGSKMRAQVNTFNGIGQWRTCMTCTELTDRFNYQFEYDGYVPESCVKDRIDNDFPGLTPEQLLEKLRKNEKELLRKYNFYQ